MALYALSDTHLSALSDKPMDIFGPRWKDHGQKIELAWNSIVGDNDTVVIGGDISWGMTLDEAKPDLLFLSRLSGRKILLRGNHDYWWSSLAKIRRFFDENGIGNIELLQNNSIGRDGFVISGTRGWYNDPDTAPAETDYRKLVLREALRLKMSLDAGKDLAGERIVFLHFPPCYQDFVCREIIDVLHEYGIERCFFGHIHGNYRVPQSYEFEGIRFCLTSADYLNFVPMRIAPANL